MGKQNVQAKKAYWYFKKDVKVNVIIILWKSLAYVTEHNVLLIIAERGNQIKPDQVK